MSPKRFLRIRHFPAEALIWFLALLSLAMLRPQDSHFTLCPFYQLGFDFCPGCGLGRSISFLLHGEFIRSWEMHPFGLFASIVLSYRIVTLTKHYIKFHGTNH